MQYFAFGEPIETAHLGGDWENAAKCVGVYDKAKKEVESLISHLQVTCYSVRLFTNVFAIDCVRVRNGTDSVGCCFIFLNSAFNVRCFRAFKADVIYVCNPHALCVHRPDVAVVCALAKKAERLFRRSDVKTADVS